MWQIWAIVAAVMVAVEIFTAGFAAICLAIGAVASAVTAALGFGVKAQIIWFALFTLFSFVVVRPIAIKMFFHKDKNECFGDKVTKKFACRPRAHLRRMTVSPSRRGRMTFSTRSSTATRSLKRRIPSVCASRS